MLDAEAAAIQLIDACISSADRIIHVGSIVQCIGKGTNNVFFGRKSQVQRLLTVVQDKLKRLEQEDICFVGDKLDEMQELTETVARTDSGKYAHSGQGSINVNEGGIQTNYVQSGSHNRQVHAGVYNETVYNNFGAASPTTGILSECLRSLAFPNMETRGDIRSKTDETCNWILEHHQYLTWKDKGGTFWIKGRPGTGKSTIQKFLLEQAQTRDAISTSNTLVASFFFHRRGEKLQYTLLGLFRSRLHQILREDDKLLSEFCRDTHFEQRCKQEGDPGPSGKWDWTEPDLRERLKICMQGHLRNHSLRLYVDALDESGEEAACDLMRYLHQLQNASTNVGSQLSICISCRPYPEVMRNYDYLVTMEHENGRDIGTYLRTEFEATTGDWTRTDSDAIRTELESRTAGVFQWAVLVSRRILSLRRESREFIIDEIKRLPKDLGDLYEEMLGSLDKSDGLALLPILRWVAFALRPLSLEDLRYAIAIDPDLSIASVEGCKQSKHWCNDDGHLADRVRRLSQGLAIVLKDEYPRVVQFDHESVKEYMSSRGILYLEHKFVNSELDDQVVGRSHSTLSKICIRYLATSELQDLDPGDVFELSFSHYAICWCLEHAKIADDHGHSQSYLIEITNWPSNQFWARWHSLSYDIDPSETKRSTLQHIASEHGLCSVLKEIAILSGESPRRSPFPWNSRSKRWRPESLGVLNERKQNALHLAAKNGHAEAVELLLSTKRIPVDTEDIDRQTPLYFAAEGGYEAVVKLLLATTNKVDVDSKNRYGYGSTPLYAAANQGHEGVVKLLLATNKVDVDYKNRYGSTPLYAAAIQGHEGVVELLLATKKVDVNVKNKDGWTPLYAAANHSHEGVVKLLLATKQVDVEMTNQFGCTPLYNAARGGHEGIVKLLLATDKVDVNVKNQDGWTPLYIAAERGHEGVVKLLLATKQVDVEVTNQFGCTPLYNAACSGREGVVRLLLATKQVDVDVKNRYGSTPLYAAAIQGHEGVVKLLLATKQVDVNVKDKDGWTPLYDAARYGHEGIVRLLLATNKVTNSKDKEGRTPLQIAIYRGHEGTAELLRAHFGSSSQYALNQIEDSDQQCR